MSIKGVAFTMYPVTDVERAVGFYRDTLGLRQEGMNEAWWVEFDVGGAAFGIGNVPGNGVPGRAESLVLEVEDIASFRNALSARGVACTEPEATPYDCSIALVHDPDGNKIWLHEKHRP